jgi:hypothetical protein
MDTTEISKIAAGGLGIVSAVTLALVGKIDGPTAMHAITWIVGVFIGGTAMLGGAKVMAGAMKKSS